MSQKMRNTDIVFTVREPVELEKDVLLPAGSYSGKCKEVGMEGLSGVSWAPPRYLIELTAEQLASIGAKHALNLISVEYDVSKYVSSGQIDFY